MEKEQYLSDKCDRIEEFFNDGLPSMNTLKLITDIYNEGYKKAQEEKKVLLTEFMKYHNGCGKIYTCDESDIERYLEGFDLGIA